LIRHGHAWPAITDYTLAQVRLFAREAATAEKHQVLMQASAIEIAFGGEEAAKKFIEENDL
jgi:hypothetical protein